MPLKLCASGACLRVDSWRGENAAKVPRAHEK